MDSSGRMDVVESAHELVHDVRVLLKTPFDAGPYLRTQRAFHQFGDEVEFVKMLQITVRGVGEAQTNDLIWGIGL